MIFMFLCTILFSNPTFIFVFFYVALRIFALDVFFLKQFALQLIQFCGMKTEQICISNVTQYMLSEIMIYVQQKNYNP